MARRELTDGFDQRSEETDEIQSTRGAAEAQADIQSAIIISRRFPRNEEKVYERLIHACKRTSFADDSTYSFPRWDSEQRKNVDITGPSVKLAREAARLWGNIRHGFVVIADSEDTRTIEGFAYDLETNTRVAQQTTFTKIVYRKAKDGDPGGYRPGNERDVREMTSRAGAFLIRNSILQLIPSDFIDDALYQAEITLRETMEKDPDEQKKSIIRSFGDLSVPIDELEAYLGHALATASPAELRKLRNIYKSIFDGNSTWSEYYSKAPAQDKPKNGSASGAPRATTNTEEKAVDAEKKAEGDKPKLDAGKLALINQLAEKKGWLVPGAPGTPTRFVQLLTGRFGIKSENEITEAMFADVLNALAGVTAEPVKSEAAPEEAEKAPAPTGRAKAINDGQKGKVWEIARAQGWARKSAKSDSGDPLHQFLKRDYGIESVKGITTATIDEILAKLEQGPKAFGFEPV